MKKSLIFLLLMFRIVLAVPAQQINNGNMEIWVDHQNYSNPASFYTMDNSFYFGAPTTIKTTDAHSGQFASLLQTIQLPSNSKIRGFMSYGSFTKTPTQNYFYGTPCTERPTKISFWYKFEPSGNDTAFAGVSFTKWTGTNSVVAQSTIGILAPTPNYVRVDIPITYTSSIIPDSIYISFISSLSQNPPVGTKFFVDDIVMGGYTSIDELNENRIALVYPNPFKDQLTVEAQIDDELLIFDIFGKELLKQTLQDGKNIINTDKLSAGVYIIQQKNVAGYRTLKVFKE